MAVVVGIADWFGMSVEVSPNAIGSVSDCGAASTWKTASKTTEATNRSKMVIFMVAVAKFKFSLKCSMETAEIR